MAKIFGKNREVDFAPGNLMSFGKSFSRMGGQPLDESEVWYDYDALVAFAAGNAAYVGMKVVYVDETKAKVYQYSIQLDGTLKEIGVAPIGDNSSIVVDAETGTVSLKGIAGLAFEKDVVDEEGKPTGEKEEVQYQPLMTKDGLVWVIPSKTTVEGLASLIDALTLRVKALEDDRVTEEELGEAIKDFATKEEVATAVKAETDRAIAAEEALGERIDAIDFVDEDELAEAIKDFETKENVKVAKDRADAAYALAETKVDATTYATDKKALEDEDAAIRAIAEGVRDSFNTFMESEDVDATINTLKEIQAELDKMAEATEITEALAAKADITYVEGELAKKQDVIAENTYDTYGSAGQALEDAKDYTDGKADEALASAQTYADGVAAQALADAKSDAANLYATKETVDNINDRVVALEEIDHSVYATKEELTTHANSAETTYAKQTDVYTTSEIDNIIAGINAGNQESASAVSNRLTAHETASEKKFGEIDAKDAAQDTAIATAQAQADKGVADAKTASEAVSALESGKVTENANEISNLKTKTDSTNTVVSGHGTSIAAIETDINTNIKPAIEALVGKDTEIEATIGNHTTAITNLQLADTELAGLISGNTQNITTINNKIGTVPTDKTVIGMIEEAIASANTYADSLAGNYDAAGSADKAFEDAKKYADGLAVNYDDFGAASTAEANAKAYADGVLVSAKAYADGLAGNYDAAGSANDALEAAKAYTDEVKAALLGTAELEGTYDTLKEIGAWIEQSGVDATELASAIAAETIARIEADTAINGRLAILEAIDHDAYVAADTALKTELADQIAVLTNGAVKANTDAIAAINDATTGILTTAKNYTDGLVGTIVQPKASNEVTVAEDGTLGLGEVSTDKLVQGSMTLILHGGDAGVATQA